MSINPQEFEDSILARIKADPEVALNIPAEVAAEFVKAKTALQISVIASDPLGMAGPQTLTPEQDAAAERYMAALTALDAATMS